LEDLRQDERFIRLVIGFKRVSNIIPLRQILVMPILLLLKVMPRDICSPAFRDERKSG
jgi:hypothetical protein